MNLTLALTPVEVDALQTAVPGVPLDVAIHMLIEPVIEKTGDARLQRLANEYRALSADDQLEAFTVLRQWREAKTRPTPEPVPDPQPEPVVTPVEPAPIVRG